jgi:hypothetical protein
MKAYKLTDEHGQTKDNTQWGPNVSHTATGDGKYLCSNGWIHFYTHPLLAVLMNPAHANFSKPRLWEAESSGEELHEQLKSGSKTLTTVRELPLPEVSDTQRIAFGILCAKEVCKDEVWNNWADKWLSGEDRTKASACAAAYAADAAADYAADAAADAADAAAAAYAASRAAFAAAYAASRAADVADAAKINFVEIAEKAMNYK